MTEEFDKYTSFTAILQQQADDGTWVDVENQPHAYAGGSTPVRAATNVMSAYVDNKILMPEGAAKLKRHRVVLTSRSWLSTHQPKTIVVTAEQVYEDMIRQQVTQHVEHRDKLPALKAALDKARAEHNQIAGWVKLGPRWIQDCSSLATTVGLSAEAIAAAAKVPPRPRQPRKKTKPGVRRDQ